ncbi:MAG: DUF2141 domain-containing protein [Bacteroidia bacterium]|nr:DUF2141 domain-containing protein [Bacteroidia bacterium]
MTTKKSILVSLLLPLFCLIFLDIKAQTCEIQLEITNFRNNKGTANIVVFDSPEGYYDDRSKSFTFKAIPIRNQKATFTCTGLTPGKGYAFVVLHDENGDAKMNTNMLGMPAEGFGVSRNAVGAFWQIKPFSEACIIPQKAKETATMKIIY